MPFTADCAHPAASAFEAEPRRRTRPLRILFATARYPPERGGTEIHTREVAQRLAARGADVAVVCTPRTPAPRVSYDGQVPVLRARAWPPNRDYYLAPALLRVIRANRTDLVHCQGYHTFVAPVAMLAALSSGTPYIVTLHSGGHSSPLRRIMRPLQARLLRPLLVRAKRIVAVSQFEADLFARRLRLPRTAFAVIPSGVDLPEPAPRPPPPGDPLILSVGRVERYKGHQRLLEVLPALVRLHQNVRVRVVGSGPYERGLRDLAEELGVTEHLEIAPVAADQRDEMRRLLQAADVVVLLSDYEAQGLAIQEAMAVGRPLVVSGASALAMLTHHPNVRAVARDAGPADLLAAILELLDKPPAPPPPMPTWDECTAALEELYDEVLRDRQTVADRLTLDRFQPVALVTVELSEPLTDLRFLPSRSGRPYCSAAILARLGGEPIGSLVVSLSDGMIRADRLADAIWRELGTEIALRVMPENGHGDGPGMLMRGAPVRVGTRVLVPRDPPRVTVIVATSGRAAQLDACLHSLRELDYPAFDVLVVDNRPSDSSTRTVVERHAAADARVRYSAEARPGCSVARNHGIAQTSSEVLAFTDDDIVVDGDWLRALVAPLVDDDEVAAVTGLVLPAEIETRAQSLFEKYRSFARGFERQAFDLSANRADAPLYPYWGGIFGSGNNMAFRRSALVGIGGFDPALGAGSLARSGSDVEALSHLVVLGHRIVYEPRALCWHHHRLEERALRRQLFNYGVGLTAIMTKWTLRRPSLPLKLLAGVWSRPADGGPARGAPSPGLPPRLRMLEIAGYTAGPFLYARSVLWARRLRLHEVIGRR